MGKINSILFFTGLSLLIVVGAFAQSNRGIVPGAIVYVNDSVVIRLHDYEGTIQWQKSNDLNVWENIPGATEDTLLVASNETSYFRAEVIAGECDPFYSDTTKIMVVDSELVDFDGNYYPVRIIGSQVWMTENLKTTSYRDGTPIQYDATGVSFQSENQVGAYVWYENDSLWKDSYGALYNWHAVNQSNGLCPAGWRVPDHEDWTKLEQFVCSQLGNEDCENHFPDNRIIWGMRGEDEGNALKSCRQINSPFGEDCETDEHPRWNIHHLHNGSDEFGFSALPGGGFIPGIGFNNLGNAGYWWTSTETNTSNAWFRTIYIYQGGISRMNYDKDIFFSVRCIMDIYSGPSYFSLRLNTIPRSGGSVSGAGHYEEDQQITLSATANPGYTFISWTENNEIISHQAEFVYTMPARDVTLSANFQWVNEDLPEPLFGVTDIDGNYYPSVIINNQEWMAENLRVAHTASGKAIDRFCYSNTTANCEIYGGLYTWHTTVNNSCVIQNNPSHVQGICPTGWRLPTLNDYEDLLAFLAAEGYQNLFNEPGSAGDALKSCRQVSSPLGGECNTSEQPRWDDDEVFSGIDAFGFSALPGGYGSPQTNNYSLAGYSSSLWTSEQSNATNARILLLTNSSGRAHLVTSSKSFGNSVRCVREPGPYPDYFNLNIEIVPEDAGVLCQPGQYEAGTPITLTGVANTGYVFLNWTLGDEILSEEATFTFIMPDEDVMLMANFSTDYGGYPIPGEGVTDFDGNFYATVIIGDQEWMAENLKVTHDPNGNSITRYCYDGVLSNCDLYGGLYTWHTMTDGGREDDKDSEVVQGICPTGWHIPSRDEFTQLERYICNLLGNANCDNSFPFDDVFGVWEYGVNEANLLKSCRQVSSPLGGECNTSDHPRWNQNNNHFGNDIFGFAALPGGHRSNTQVYFQLGNSLRFWTSSSASFTQAHYRSISSTSGGIFRDLTWKNEAKSIRCVKDNTTHGAE